MLIFSLIFLFSDHKCNHFQSSFYKSLKIVYIIRTDLKNHQKNTHKHNVCVYVNIMADIEFWNVASSGDRRSESKMFWCVTMAAFVIYSGIQAFI